MDSKLHHDLAAVPGSRTFGADMEVLSHAGMPVVIEGHHWARPA